LERLWGVVREKRNLVNSVVGLARLYEQGGQFSEALGQWQTLQIIYGEYPNLDAEIARVQALRDQTASPTVGYDTEESAHLVEDELQGRDTERNSYELPLSPHEQTERSSAYEIESKKIRQRPAQRPNESHKRETREFDLDELERLRLEAEAAEKPETLEDIATQVRTLSRSYPDDAEVQERCSHILDRLRKVEQYRDSENQSGASGAMPAELDVGDSSAQEPTPVNGDADALEAQDGAHRISAGARTGSQSFWRRHPEWVFGVSSTIVMLGLTAVIVVRLAKHGPPASPQLIDVEVRTSPGGAAVDVNGKDRGVSPLKIPLRPGRYHFKVDMDGYNSSEEDFTVSASTSSIDVRLEPLPPLLRISSDLDAGTVWLDQKHIGDLRQGQFSMSLEPGPHGVRVEGREGSADLTFTALPGRIPVLTNFGRTKNFSVWVLTTCGAGGKVYSGVAPLRLVVDGEPRGEIRTEGLELNSLGRGDHEFELDRGRVHHRNTITVGGAAAVAIFLSSERNVGTLVVSVGADDVQVLVDGKERGLTQGGTLRVSDLPVRAHTVEVEKAGFERPQPQAVQLRKGEDTRVEFHLRAFPSVAALHIDHARSGASVLLDGGSLGTVRPDGSFDKSNIDPGKHKVRLDLDRYRSIELQRDFGGGKTVTLSGADVSMEPLQGTLALSIEPDAESVTIRDLAGATVRTLDKTQVLIKLPLGQYRVTAHWADGSDQSQDVLILPDKNSFLRFVPHPLGMDGWENPSSWTREAVWFVHEGGGFVLFHHTPTIGRFDFAAQIRKGHNLFLVVGYANDSNYFLYQMDEKSFRRVVTINGRRETEPKGFGGFGKDRTCTLRVEVKDDSVVLRRYEGGNWQTLDTWQNTGRGIGNGKFGLFISPGEVVALGNFKVSA
jgi:hypothetical protein